LALQHHQDNSEGGYAMNWRTQAAVQPERLIGFAVYLFAVSSQFDLTTFLRLVSISANIGRTEHLTNLFQMLERRLDSARELGCM